MAAGAALLLSALPGTVAAAEPVGARVCKVFNVDQGIGRNTLQRAVWAAEAGDTLIVRGSCVGTTFIAKDDLTIGNARASVRACTRAGRCRMRDSGPPTLKGGGTRPAIVVHPDASGLDVRPGLLISGGVRVDEVGRPRGSNQPAGAKSGRSVPDSGLSRCHVSNRSLGHTYSSMQGAVDAATAGDSLLFRGKCHGRTVFDKDLQVTGHRVATSSIVCDRHGRCSRPQKDDSGPARLGSVVVKDGVEGLSLRKLGFRGGLIVE